MTLIRSVVTFFSNIEVIDNLQVKNCIHVSITSAKASPGLNSAFIINGTRNRYLRAVDSRFILSNVESSNRSSKCRNSGSVKIDPFLWS